MKTAQCLCGWAAILSLIPAAMADGSRIENSGPQRYEWRASTFSTSAQEEAALAVAPDGSSVVVWSSRRQQTGSYGVYAQRFDRDGIALGGETQVNLWTRSHQTAPTVAVAPTGDVWIAWQSHGQDGNRGSIVARRFDRDLVGGSEFLVNQTTRGHQSAPVLTIGRNGTVAIGWVSQESFRERPRVVARVFNPDGSPRTDEFTLGTADGRREGNISLAAGNDGCFAAVFAVFDADHLPLGIRLQRFSATGERLGDQIDVCGQRRNSQVEPVIAGTPGGFIAAWLDAESDGSDYGVLARRFDLTGSAAGAPFVVNTRRDGSQNAAAIAVAADGRFAIAWNSADEDDSGIFARMFAADGTPAGGEVRLTKQTQGAQSMSVATGTRRLAFSADGDLLCAWNGDGGFGDKSAIQVSMLTPRTIDLADRVQGVTAEMLPAQPLLAQAGGPGPHIPPTFDPRDIDEAEREVVLGINDIGFTAIVNTGWTPPDPHMAVGPDHIVVMTNGAIAFFEKDGTMTFQDEIEDSFGFWGNLGTTGFVFDPEVLYDELSGRFFAMAAEAYVGNRSYVLVAVSDDSDPNGNWHKYRFETSSLAGDLFDSPNIAVDDQALYITGDGFGITSNYPIFIFDKASLLVGNPPVITKQLTLATSTQSAGIPPVSFDNPPALYMIEHQEGGSNTQVRLIALQNPLTTPTITSTNLTVPAYGPPEDPPQAGTSSRPETFDARFWRVAYRNGSLWATHHINSSRVLARWYEIDMRGWPDSGDTPVLVQSGNIDPGANIRTFFCSITVDDFGNAAICYARSSPSEFISMATSYRLASDPLGTMRPSTIHKTTVGGYNSGRWGDYSAVEVDPANGRTFWAHHEYAQSGSWRTWVQSITPPATKADMNCDGVIDGADIDPFFLALGFPDQYAQQFPNCDPLNGDMDSSGALDGGDIDPFFDCVGNGNCP